MWYFILVVLGNRLYLLGRLTHKLTEDIATLFSLLSNSAHTGVDQDGIHHFRNENNDNATMSDVYE